MAYSRTRTTVGSIITVIGLSLVVMATKAVILHFVYPDSLLLVNLSRGALFALSVLAVGLLILGKGTVPPRLWVFYFVCFLGIGLVVAPLRRDDSSRWSGVDTGVCIAGAILAGGPLYWAYALKRAQPSTDPAKGEGS